MVAVIAGASLAGSVLLVVEMAALVLLTVGRGFRFSPPAVGFQQVLVQYFGLL